MVNKKRSQYQMNINHAPCLVHQVHYIFLFFIFRKIVHRCYEDRMRLTYGYGFFHTEALCSSQLFCMFTRLSGKEMEKKKKLFHSTNQNPISITSIFGKRVRCYQSWWTLMDVMTENFVHTEAWYRERQSQKKQKKRIMEENIEVPWWNIIIHCR